MAVAGGLAVMWHIQYETQRTQEAFGVRPRVRSIIHDRWRLSIYLGPCRTSCSILRPTRAR